MIKRDNSPRFRGMLLISLSLSLGLLLSSTSLHGQPEPSEPEASESPRNLESALRPARLFPALGLCWRGISDEERKRGCEDALGAVLQIRQLLIGNEANSSFHVPDCDVSLSLESSDGNPGRCNSKRELRNQLDALITKLQQQVKRPVALELSEDIAERQHFLARNFADFHAARAAEMSVVMRGGLSLGNYQAGFLYYVSQYLKARSELLRIEGEVPTRRGFSTIAGASAGGLNALISSIDSCMKPEADPEQSLYFKGWTHVGMFGRHGRSGLVVDGREAESSLGILSKRPVVDATEMVFKSARRNREFEDSCPGVNLGITVTRLAPERFSLHYKSADSASEHPEKLRTVLGALKQAEKILFRLEFEPTPGALQQGEYVVKVKPLRPFVPFEDGEKGRDPRAAVRQFYLAYGDGYEKNGNVGQRTLALTDLAPVLYATSSFPVAFSPEEFTYTRVGRDGIPFAVETARFVDGGVFDNTPLGLAITIDRWNLERRAQREYEARGKLLQPTKSAWLDPHESSCLFKRTSTLEQLLCDVLPVKPRDYLFIEPTVVDFESWMPDDPKTAQKKNKVREAILPTVAQFAGSFLGTSMGASLVATAQANPFITETTGDTILPRLLVPERHLPLASERLENFMGFFEEDFRVFDFYVGLLDAETFIAKDSVYASLEVAPSIQSPRYVCMRDYYRRSGDGAGEISGGDLPESCFALEPSSDGKLLVEAEDIDELTEEAIHRMEEDWERGDDSAREIERLFAAERKLSGQNFRALLVAMHNFKVWMISGEYDTEQEFTKFFEVLEESGFTFVDMQRIRIAERIKITTGARARLVVRDLMQKGVIQLARAQPEFDERVKLRMLGGIGADLYEARPTWAQISLGLNFNGIESYFGWYLGKWRKFRLDLGARLYQLGPRSFTDAQDDEYRFFASDAAAFTRLSFAVAEGTFSRLEFGIGFIGSELFAWNRGSDKAHVAFRYGPEFTGSISILRHFYVDTQLDIFIDGCSGQFSDILNIPEKRCLMNHKDYPDEEVHIFNKDWRFTLGAGWRWNL